MSYEAEAENPGKLVEAILRERYPPLYPSDYLLSRRRRISASPPPLCVRRFEASVADGSVTSSITRRSSSAVTTLPRLPGIGHLILTDKTESSRISRFDRQDVRREMLTSERDDVDTDGSIPDLSEVVPPPRRRKRQKDLERTAILSSANSLHLKQVKQIKIGSCWSINILSKQTKVKP